MRVGAFGLYRRRLLVNRFNLVMSLATMAVGMGFLLWILFVLFANGFKWLIRAERAGWLPRRYSCREPLGNSKKSSGLPVQCGRCPLQCTSPPLRMRQ